LIKILWIKLKKIKIPKKKHYRCIIQCSKKIDPEKLDQLNKLNKFDIDQKTPVRVLHRRSLLVRKRSIFHFSGRIINPYHIDLELVTQGGTYVKEFVHGDFGRTIPNLSALLDCDCDLLLLDVTQVEFNHPPFLKDQPEINYCSMIEELKLN